MQKIKLFEPREVIVFTQNDVIEIVENVKMDLNEFCINYVC